MKIMELKSFRDIGSMEILKTWKMLIEIRGYTMEYSYKEKFRKTVETGCLEKSSILSLMFHNLYHFF